MSPRLALKSLQPVVLLLALMACLPLLGPAYAKDEVAAPSEHYEIRPASRDGIGKFYMGREISHVMGHLGAGWLERPERVREERTDLLLQALNLQPDDTVVDLGAGTGYFSGFGFGGECVCDFQGAPIHHPLSASRGAPDDLRDVPQFCKRGAGTKRWRVGSETCVSH